MLLCSARNLCENSRVNTRTVFILLWTAYYGTQPGILIEASFENCKITVFSAAKDSDRNSVLTGPLLLFTITRKWSQRLVFGNITKSTTYRIAILAAILPVEGVRIQFILNYKSFLKEAIIIIKKLLRTLLQYRWKL